jgi:outer membrane lipoprotein-sorting protein
MKYLATIMIIALLIPGTTSLLAQQTGAEIMQMAYDRPDGDDYSGNMRMTLINKRGSTRVREMKIYSKDEGEDTKSLTYFTKPADVRGTGFLQYEYDDPEKEDDRWLYLPALKKSRRITGSSDDDSFMGSDFTYDDWGGRTLEEDTHKLLREETLDGEACWVIESKPKDEDNQYSRFVSWIRQNSYVEKKVEFYDRRGELLKILNVEELKQVSGYWTPFRMVMKNVQDEHQTIIEQLDIEYDQGLSDSLFRVSSLERGRIR